MIRLVMPLLLSLFLFIAPARADCDNPHGFESQQNYDFVHNLMRYCDGEHWRALYGTTMDLNSIDPAAGGTQILEQTSVTCTGSLLPLVISCTATCPPGFWRSGCFASAGTAVPHGTRGCHCALADQQCTAFCLK